MLKKSKPFIQKTKIDTRFVVIYEILISIDNYFIIPDDKLKEKIHELIQFLEDKYFPLPNTTKDIEIIDKEYERCVKYVEILE